MGRLTLPNDKGHAGGSQVLLRAAIDADVLGDIHRAGEDIRRHIAHQRHVDIGVGLQLGAKNGVVGRDMKVVRIGGHGIIFRNEGVVGIG